MKLSRYYDVIVVGAGAAGLTTAIVAAKQGLRVSILERNAKAGKKIAVSGNGRCNITHTHIAPDRYYATHDDFVAQVLHGYDSETIRCFLSELGIPTVAKEDGRCFPLSMSAKSVVDQFLYEVERLGVTIRYKEEVTKVSRDKEEFFVVTPHTAYRCGRLVLANGSCAAPKLGGSDSGYALAESLGHRLVTPLPALVQLHTYERWVERCAGVKHFAEVTLRIDGTESQRVRGDVLFTRYGVSGLAILDLSTRASLALHAGSFCEIEIDLFPNFSRDALFNLLYAHLDRDRNKPLRLWLEAFIPPKLVPIVLKEAHMEGDDESQLSRKRLHALVYTLKHLKLSIEKTHGFEHAEVAVGGVDTTDIDPVTMASKRCDGLYFAGEILDVCGERGGFNFHFAFVSALRAANDLAVR